jgi:RNA polymerase sigma-70 factor (ECF subfamily)
MAKERQILETLFKRHYRQMYRMAIILLHDDAESKDVVHDVFTQLLAESKELKEETSEAFLLTCVRNKCTNVIRGRKIRERVQRLYLLDINPTVIPTDLFREEELRLLNEGINQLTPPVHREVIEWHFRDGLTFREIAIRLGVSETTVYKYLRHSLQQLRTHIKKD